MQKDGSTGFPSYHPLPSFMEGKGPEPSVGAKKHPKRAFFHDYCSPGYYLITATTLPGSPRLSEIPALDSREIKKGEMILPELTPLGKIIKDEILAIPVHHPELKILRFVVMPDHIHIVLGIHTRLKRMLGSELAGFFGACSKASSRIQGITGIKTLFKTFHDRLIFSHEQLDKSIKYVEDNPRRYILRKRFPELFRRYVHLEIAGHEYAAFGNIFLLKEIYLLPIRVHRRWSEAEFSEYSDYCRKEIDNGAVPITPAIHPAEKAIIDYAKKNGGKMIILKEQGFEEQFKPQGENFDLCSAGRLLLLAPWPDNTGRKSRAGYGEFHKMNDLARTIASLSPSTRLLLKSQEGNK